MPFDLPSEPQAERASASLYRNPACLPSVSSSLWGTQRRSHHHGYFRQRRPERQRYAARARLSKRHSEQGSGVDCRYCHCRCDHRCVCVRIQQFGRPPRSRANPRRGASARTVCDPSAAGGSQSPCEAVTGFSESPPSRRALILDLDPHAAGFSPAVWLFDSPSQEKATLVAISP